MKCFGIAVPLIFLAVVACGCGVTAQRHEELQAKRNDLQRDLDTTKLKLDAAQKDHLKASAKYEEVLSSLREQLAAEKRNVSNLSSQLEQLQADYQASADAASQSAKDNLSLIEEKKKLTDTIIELQGTILTLRDTIKDLETRLQEQTSKSSPAPGEPEPAP